MGRAGAARSAWHSSGISSSVSAGSTHIALFTRLCWSASGCVLVAREGPRDDVQHYWSVPAKRVLNVSISPGFSYRDRCKWCTQSRPCWPISCSPRLGREATAASYCLLSTAPRDPGAGRRLTAPDIHVAKRGRTNRLTSLI